MGLVIGQTYQNWIPLNLDTVLSSSQIPGIMANLNWFCEVVVFHEPDGIDLPTLSTLLTYIDNEDEYPSFTNVNSLVLESRCVRQVLLNRSSLPDKSRS